jgi:hypothetical protein
MMRTFVLILVSVILVAAAVVTANMWNFRRRVNAEVKRLFAQASRADNRLLVTADSLDRLPLPVQRYLTYAGVVGKPVVNSVRIRQTGVMLPAPDKPAMSFTAEQYYSVNPPGFVWKASIRMAGLPLAQVRDKYMEGSGHILGKIAGLFTMIELPPGQEVREGTLLRFLSEMVWFPSAFLSPYITWEPIDDCSAQVTLTDRGCSVTGRLYFDREGRLTSFVAKRYRAVDGRYELEEWHTPVEGYGSFEGLRLPIKGPAIWKLKTGDLPYVNVTITDVQYDIPELYGSG